MTLDNPFKNYKPSTLPGEALHAFYSYLKNGGAIVGSFEGIRILTNNRNAKPISHPNYKYKCAKVRGTNRWILWIGEK